MHTVHNSDKEVVEVIKPNLQNGPWIAGGAPLKWYNNQPVGGSDIDVFCSSKHQSEQVIKRLALSFVTSNDHKSDNAITMSVVPNNSETINTLTPFCETDTSSWNKSAWKIQIIIRDYFTDVHAVLDTFDITVCQIATAGNEWILCDNTAKDIRERNLRMIMPLRKSSAKRLLKYWSYGYRPVDGLVESINKEEHFEKTIAGDYAL